MLRLRGFEYFERFGEVLKVFEEFERSKTAQKQKKL